MPTIEFIGSAFGAYKCAEASEGGDLLDLCDQCFAPIPFSCRSASCGTCHVDVLAGADLLEPPRARELELLELLHGPSSSRLACQVRVRPGPGLVRLRSLLLT